MKKYAKIEDEKTKLCTVGIGENIQYYKSLGMIEQEVEQAWNGAWYIAGHKPDKPVFYAQHDVRMVRNQYLNDTDKYFISDYPITDEDKENYRQYRVYLRDYTKNNDWWLNNPETFEKWLEGKQ